MRLLILFALLCVVYISAKPHARHVERRDNIRHHSAQRNRRQEWDEEERLRREEEERREDERLRKWEEDMADIALRAPQRRRGCKGRFPRPPPQPTTTHAPQPLRRRCPPRMRTPHTEDWYNTNGGNYRNDIGYGAQPVQNGDYDSFGRSIYPAPANNGYEAPEIRRSPCPALRPSALEGMTEQEIMRYAVNAGCSHDEIHIAIVGARERKAARETATWEQVQQQPAYPSSYGNALSNGVFHYPVLFFSRTRGWIKIDNEEERRVFEMQENEEYRHLQGPYPIGGPVQHPAPQEQKPISMQERIEEREEEEKDDRTFAVLDEDNMRAVVYSDGEKPKEEEEEVDGMKEEKKEEIVEKKEEEEAAVEREEERVQEEEAPAAIEEGERLGDKVEVEEAEKKEEEEEKEEAEGTRRRIRRHRRHRAEWRE